MMCYPLLYLVAGAQIVLADALTDAEVLDQIDSEEGSQEPGNACKVGPFLGLECKQSRKMFYYDLLTKTCKRKTMCPPEEFLNAFATAESCENLCVNDVDEEEVQEGDDDESLESPLASRTVHGPWNRDPGYHPHHQNVKLNLYMTATSSSQYKSSNSPSRAVDGRIATDWNYMFHSGTGDSYPWLVVDMNRFDLIVHKILVHIRPETSVRFNNVEARVGPMGWTKKKQKISPLTYCACPSDYIGNGVAAREFICKKPVKGRYLSLQILSPARYDLYLEVNEIEVYGGFAQVPFVGCSRLRMENRKNPFFNGYYKHAPHLYMSYAPERPIYVQEGGSGRMIFWNAGGLGWCTGTKEALATAAYFDYSRNNAPEPWMGEWRGNDHGKIHVYCA